jgi:hypothetical protein
MRILFAVAILVGIAAASQAGAADLGNGVDRYGPPSADYYVGADRAGALIVYDFEPGIVQRAYWLPPWRNRHYFPFHAEKVRQVPAGRPIPAEPYFRYWSNDGAMIYAPPPEALQSFGAAPRGRDRAHAATPKVKDSATDDSAASLFE